MSSFHDVGFPASVDLSRRRSSGERLTSELTPCGACVQATKGETVENRIEATEAAQAKERLEFQDGQGAGREEKLGAQKVEREEQM